MTGLSGKLKLVIGLLIGVVTIPMFVLGIIYLVAISPANIWGWMFIGFGFTLLLLIATLITTIRGTTISRYETEFDT